MTKPRSLRLNRHERAIIIGVAAINGAAAFSHGLTWCTQGLLYSFVLCQFSLSVTMWLLVKTKPYW